MLRPGGRADLRTYGLGRSARRFTVAESNFPCDVCCNGARPNFVRNDGAEPVEAEERKEVRSAPPGLPPRARGLVGAKDRRSSCASKLL